MNVFYVDTDPEQAARTLCDQHVVKMPLETAQILSTVANSIGLPAPYKPTHRHHPTVVWAGAARAHARWLWQHGMALCQEYTRRFGRQHACEPMIVSLADSIQELPDLPWQAPPQVMPVQFQRADPVQAYRSYYLSKNFARWRHSDPPSWAY